MLREKELKENKELGRELRRKAPTFKMKRESEFIKLTNMVFKISSRVERSADEGCRTGPEAFESAAGEKPRPPANERISVCRTMNISGSGSPVRLKGDRLNTHLSDAFDNFKTKSSLLLGKFLHNQPNPFFRNHPNQQQPFDPLSIRILSSKKRIANAFEVTTTKVTSSRSNAAANQSHGFGNKSRKNSDPHVKARFGQTQVGTARSANTRPTTAAPVPLSSHAFKQPQCPADRSDFRPDGGMQEVSEVDVHSPRRLPLPSEARVLSHKPAKKPQRFQRAKTIQQSNDN